MELSVNHYRKFLIDEVMRSSNATIHGAISEVNNFSKTDLFHESYAKWVVLQKRYKKNPRGPRSMKDILKD